MQRKGKKKGIFDVVGLGYTALDYLGIVPHLPERDRKLELKRFLIQGGGPTATAMVTVRRLGLSSAYIGKVGDDGFGKRMIEELAAEGVDTAGVLVEPGADSQFAFIMVDETTADRTILWTRGSVSGIRADEVDTHLITSARALLIDDLEPEAAAVAARTARGKGIPVLIDAGSLRSGVRELLPLCDYIVASEVFAAQIAGGIDVSEALERLYSFGPKAVVVTRGRAGCVAFDGTDTIEAEGFTVEAVDTTGAGDVFHGAFLFAVLQGWNLYEMCVFANAVAALKCRRLGGRAGIPDITEALVFLEERVPRLSFDCTDGDA
ncbi:MAG: sugar kinase [bacterium]|nr:MAG: sugar kinase [bacterium]